MALTAQQREDAWKWLVTHRAASGIDSPVKWSKDDLRTALDAAVAWIEANQASYAASLATTAFAGANSTADEKLRLFLAALSIRYGITVN